MSARVETRWKGVTGEVDLVVTVPTGGADYNCTIDDTCDTHAALATAIQTELDAMAPGTWGCTVNADTGAFTISVGSGTFDLEMKEPLKKFTSLPDATNVSSVTGSSYPPSQFRSDAPLPEPDPFWRLVRSGTVTDGGRVVSRLHNVHPLQPVQLRWGPVDQTETDLVEWLSYVLGGERFSLFRSSDSALYKLVDGTPNPDGRSLCVLTRRSREVALEWLTNPRRIYGVINLQARILEGY